MLGCCPSFRFWFWVSSFRVVAGLDEVSSDVSCSKDVEDVLAVELEEPVDNHGTTIGMTFSVLHRILFPCLTSCGFLTTVLRRA